MILKGKAVLTKLRESNIPYHPNHREVGEMHIGWVNKDPTTLQHFYLYHVGGEIMKVFRTSLVMSVTPKPYGFEFETLNSIYELKYIENDAPPPINPRGLGEGISVGPNPSKKSPGRRAPIPGRVKNNPAYYQGSLRRN
jgi:hypothetical protein